MDVIQLLDDDSLQLDTRSINIIESLINTPLVQDNIYTTVIDGYLIEKYRGNFYGLLHNELNVLNNSYYINLRVNGLKSPLDYNGFMEIKLVKQDVVLKILETIRE